MLSIRLSRTGKKGQPSFRVVIMEKHRDPWGKALEILGHYNPRRTPTQIELKPERIKHWLSQGATVSDTLWNILVAQKIVEGSPRPVTHLSKKRRDKIAKETPAPEEKS